MKGVGKVFAQSVQIKRGTLATRWRTGGARGEGAIRNGPGVLGARNPVKRHYDGSSKKKGVLLPPGEKREKRSTPRVHARYRGEGGKQRPTRWAIPSELATGKTASVLFPM